MFLNKSALVSIILILFASQRQLFFFNSIPTSYLIEGDRWIWNKIHYRTCYKDISSKQNKIDLIYNPTKRLKIKVTLWRKKYHNYITLSYFFFFFSSDSHFSKESTSRNSIFVKKKKEKERKE